MNLIRKYERPRSSTLILQKLTERGDVSQSLAHWILSNNSAEEWCVEFCLKIRINTEPEQHEEMDFAEVRWRKDSVLNFTITSFFDFLRFPIRNILFSSLLTTGFKKRRKKRGFFFFSEQICNILKFGLRRAIKLAGARGGYESSSGYLQ